MKIVSFFSGCGGLDLGFRQAGFDVVWANEFDFAIHPTYMLNHPDTYLCKKDMRLLKANDIPACDGFIGGPPCQSWSVGGRNLGLQDERGKLFLNYINLIEENKPKFFVIENVEGIITDRHYKTFLSFISRLSQCGYNVFYDMLNASNYKIPQDRKRIFIVGFIRDLNCSCYKFPQPESEVISLQKAISDITEPPKFYCDEMVNPIYHGKFYNHDCYAGPFDRKFMSRNRVRSWNEVSFTIQALAKNCPLHPQAPKMHYVDQNKREFLKGYEYLYRRLSVRECARIQTFPDNFRFIYSDVKAGYKMVGNAVPPRLAYRIALSIKECLEGIKTFSTELALVGFYKDLTHYKLIKKNKLYYVRIGVRKGNFKQPAGLPFPKILILHNRQVCHYFKLKEKKTYCINGDKLKEMGFNPAGNDYLAFEILSEIELRNPNEGIEMRLNRTTVSPYLLEVSKYLFNV